MGCICWRAAASCNRRVDPNAATPIAIRCSDEAAAARFTDFFAFDFLVLDFAALAFGALAFLPFDFLALAMDLSVQWEAQLMRVGGNEREI